MYSIGSKPLQIWDCKNRNGHIKRITDNDIQSLVLEIAGTNVATTYVTCPADPKKTLGIKLPFLVMIIKNLNKYFTFEVQVRLLDYTRLYWTILDSMLKVLDDKNVRRRFRASNYQSTTRVKPFICTMPMRLDEGWNQIQFNLSDFTRRAYGTNYIETLRVQVRDYPNSKGDYPFMILFRFTLIVESVEFISLIDSTLKMNCQLNLNCTYLYKRNRLDYHRCLISSLNLV